MPVSINTIEKKIKTSQNVDDTLIATQNITRQSFTTTQRLHHKRMAREQRQYST